eukprot:30813-Pelagococcus_subviridis.AAC.3
MRDGDAVQRRDAHGAVLAEEFREVPVELVQAVAAAVVDDDDLVDDDAVVVSYRPRFPFPFVFLRGRVKSPRPRHSNRRRSNHHLLRFPHRELPELGVHGVVQHPERVSRAPGSRAVRGKNLLGRVLDPRERQRLQLDVVADGFENLPVRRVDGVQRVGVLLRHAFLRHAFVRPFYRLQGLAHEPLELARPRAVDEAHHRVVARRSRRVRPRRVEQRVDDAGRPRRRQHVRTRTVATIRITRTVAIRIVAIAATAREVVHDLRPFHRALRRVDPRERAQRRRALRGAFAVYGRRRRAVRLRALDRDARRRALARVLAHVRVRGVFERANAVGVIRGAAAQLHLTLQREVVVARGLREAARDGVKPRFDAELVGVARGRRRRRARRAPRQRAKGRRRRRIRRISIIRRRRRRGFYDAPTRRARRGRGGARRRRRAPGRRRRGRRGESGRRGRAREDVDVVAPRRRRALVVVDRGPFGARVRRGIPVRHRHDRRVPRRRRPGRRRRGTRRRRRRRRGVAARRLALRSAAPHRARGRASSDRADHNEG